MKRLSIPTKQSIIYIIATYINYNNYKIGTEHQAFKKLFITRKFNWFNMI